MAEEPVKKSAVLAPVASTFNAQFFVMPEAYRHGKDVAMVEPKTEVKKQMVQTPPVPVKPTVPVPPVPQATVAKSKTTKALLISGLIVLIALGIGGYLVVRSLQKQPVVEPEPVVVTPPPREAPVVEPVPAEGGEPVEPVVEPDTTPSKQVIPGRDRDSDGLSDTEEQLVYGTNPNLPDSDADGFLDGNEVFHKYNPNGTSSGTLVGSGLAFERVEGNIRLTFPAIWTVGQRVNEEDTTFRSGLLFVSTTGEQVRVAFSGSGLDPTELLALWKAGFQEMPIGSTSKGGYPLYVSTDNLQAFLIVGDRAVRFEYDQGIKATVDYIQTFQMMINSVERVDESL